MIFLGVLVGFNTIAAPALNPPMPEDVPFWFPFLFVTVACGAISGFHSLVASGTTSKQLDRETDAPYVGYMGSLGEGWLALGSILAVTVGIGIVGLNWAEEYATWEPASGGAVGHFVDGVAGFTNNHAIRLEFGTIFAALMVISFAATTLDSGVWLQRYIFQEIGGIVGWRWLCENLNAVTLLAVLAPARARDQSRARLRADLDSVGHDQPAHRRAGVTARDEVLGAAGQSAGLPARAGLEMLLEEFARAHAGGGDCPLDRRVRHALLAGVGALRGAGPRRGRPLRR